MHLTRKAPMERLTTLQRNPLGLSRTSACSSSPAQIGVSSKRTLIFAYPINAAFLGIDEADAAIRCTAGWEVAIYA